MRRTARARLTAPLLAALLALAGCGGAETDLSQDAEAEESYLLLQIHRAWAKEATDAISQLWSWCGASGRIDSSQWAEHKRITVYPVTNSNHYGTTFEFSDLGYDASQTEISYGTPKAVSTPATLNGSRYIYDLSAEDQAGEFSQTDSITLSQERSVSITHGVTFDASVSSETTVGGEFAGIGVEQKITATFGFEDTQEEQRAKSESSDITVSHDFKVPLDAGRITYISVASDDISSSTPMSISGVADAQVAVTLGEPCAQTQDWYDHAGGWVYHPDNEHIWDCWGSNPHGTRFPGDGTGRALYNWYNWLDSHPCPWSTTMGGIEAILDGRDAAWQGLAGDRHGVSGSWLDNAPSTVRAAVEAATGSHLRAVDISGLQHRDYQRGTKTVVAHIASGDIDKLVQDGASLCEASSTTC